MQFSLKVFTHWPINWFCILVCVSLAAWAIYFGTVVFLDNCDKSLSLCSHYYEANTIVAGYSTTESVCSACVESQNYCTSYGCTSNCTDYSYFPCYDSYADAVYSIGSNNYTCFLSVDTDNPSWNDSMADAQSSYPLGSQYTYYVRKSNHHCYDYDEINHTGIGFAYLAVGFVCTFLSCAFYYCLVYSKGKVPTNEVEMISQASAYPLNKLPSAPTEEQLEANEGYYVVHNPVNESPQVSVTPIMVQLID